MLTPSRQRRRSSSATAARTPLGDVERVRLRLPDDAEADAGLAVDADASSSVRPGRRSRRPRRRRGSIRLMRIASTSSPLVTLASARTSSDWSLPERLPAGASSATVSSAVSRSATVRPRAASAFGSISTRTSGSRSPFSVTSATPSTAASRSTMLSSTSCVRSWIVMSRAVTASRMIASELSSALTIETSSTSSGSWRSTLPTASRRSFAATLRSTEFVELDHDAARAGAARSRRST